MDRYPPALQRPALLELAKALGSRDRALRRDECGDWRINGAKGHVYAVPGGFQLMVTGCETARQWTAAKKALAFAKVTQDGDEEGGLMLGRLPTAGEASAMRHYLGVAKKRELSEADLARLRAFASNHGFRTKLPA
jgi:hypothetical protein